MKAIKKIFFWSKENLFSGPWQSFITILCLFFIYKIFVPIFTWLLIDSVWSGDVQTCRESSGACLLFIREKSRFILFGFYPEASLWRPITALIIFIGFLYIPETLNAGAKNGV
jgi:general L-amino acid transport system permease protein